MIAVSNEIKEGLVTALEQTEIKLERQEKEIEKL